MKNFPLNLSVVLAVLLGGAGLVAAPHALVAGGICEEFCGGSCADVNGTCRPLDGCVKSQGICMYEVTTECDECEGGG